MKRKKLLSILLTLALLCSLLPMAALPAAAAEPEPAYEWYIGKESPYTVSTAADLAGFAAIVNGTADGIAIDTFSGKTVTLGADVDLSAYTNWTPIGDYSYTNFGSFAGTFDGGSHTISGLTINAEASAAQSAEDAGKNVQSPSSYHGLFGNVAQGATIKDLTVSGTVAVTFHGKQFKTSNAFAGSIAGRTSSGTFSNLVSNVTIMLTRAEDSQAADTGYAGGLAGNSTGTWTNCANHGSVTGPSIVGGLIGKMESSGSLAQCWNDGAVTRADACTVQTSKVGFVGGLVGQTYTASTYQTCYNSGAVTDSVGQGATESIISYAGGLFGSLEASGVLSLNGCYNIGSVTGFASGAAYAGGLAGNAVTGRSSYIINSCYNAGTVIGAEGKVGVLFGKTGDYNPATIQKTYYLENMAAAPVGVNTANFSGFSTLDADGLYHAASNGKLAATYFKTGAERPILVWQADEPHFVLTQAAITLAVGETATLTADVYPADTAIVWSSGNETVVTVDENGTVTPVADGETVITATSNGKSDTCTVKVTAKYTVAFEPNGGSEVAPQSVYSGEKLTSPKCTRTGYTVEGWYDNENLEGTAWNFSTDTVDTEIPKLYVKWKPIEYSIAFVSSSSTNKASKALANGTMDNQAATYGQSVTLPESGFTPKDASDQFCGWATGGRKSDQPVVYKDGATVSNLASTNNTIFTIYAAFAKEITTVSGYKTEYACGEEFDATGIAVMGKDSANIEKDITVSTTFSGFDSTSPGEKTVTATCGTLTKDFTVTVLDQYIISFVDEDGTELWSDKVDTGTMPVYGGPTPTKEANAQYTYEFAGWDKELVYVIGADTYTATYSSVVNEYTVKFVDDEGTELSSASYDYGTAAADIVTPDAPEKEPTVDTVYPFNGWTPALAEVTGDATYTATYTEATQKYTIKFVNADGTVLQSSEVEYSQTPTYTGATPTKAETASYTYSFKGWDKAIAAVSGEATYTATFTSNAKSSDTGSSGSTVTTPATQPETTRTEESETAADGSEITTVTEKTEDSKTNADGSVTDTSSEKTTETVSAPDGSKTVTETVAETEITTGTVQNDDGSVTETVASATKETAKETVTDADGNVTETVTETEVKKNVETTVDADGKTSGSGTVETTTTVTDEAGNVLSTAVTEGEISISTAEDGVVSEVTKAKTTITDAEGNVTEETTVTTEAVAPDGSSATVVEDGEGNTLRAEANISEQAYQAAKESGSPIMIPVTVNPDSEAAISVEMPEMQEGETAQVEIGLTRTGPGVVAYVLRNGEKSLDKTCRLGSLIVTVEGDSELVIIDNDKSFDDVDADKWYGFSVSFVTAREIFNGNGNGTFSPRGRMNRAMVAQVLYNLCRGAEAGNGAVFSDVAESAWYFEAVGWAAENKLIEGWNGAYAPLTSVTRQDLVTILYRYVKFAGYDVAGVGDGVDLGVYGDGAEVSDYAAEAMRWAVGSGLIQGYTDNTLHPKDTATRAEVAALIQRMITEIVK